MQLIDFVGTVGIGVAVEDVDDTVAIDVFIRIADAVVVQIPAGLSRSTVGTVGTVCAIYSVRAIVTFTACKSEA
jgi:hypothetical protein